MTSNTAPSRIKNTRINLYVPTALRDALAELARAGNRPLAREARAALEAHVERQREQARGVRA